MTGRVWLGGASIPLATLAPLGQGGEADVYDLGDGRALKVFKTPAHPDVAGIPALEAAARARLDELQAKLPAFPRGLPVHVVRPHDLARRGRRGAVAGYAMAKVDGAPLHRWAEPHARRAAPVAANEIVAALRHLHVTVEAVHRAGVVIGDFNDANVLVAGGRCWLIDADSWQYGAWRCAMYSERFVDPRLCDPAAPAPALARPHDPDGDWFAFAVMLVRSLLMVGPYGGVFAPADPARRVAQGTRPLRGVSIFDPEVVLPRAAVPWRVLPDELIDHLRAVFEGGRRGPFPAALLDRLRFRRCACGLEVARPDCPACRTFRAPPPATVRGRVRAVAIDPGALAATSWPVGAATRPVWLDGATLWRQTPLGAEAIGQVVPGLTRAWCGARLGVGLYRAGGYTQAFVFRPDRRGLRDGIAIPRLRGRLVDVHGEVADDRAWLWWREALGGAETVRCAAIGADGAVLGLAEAPADDAGWLAGVPGACAAGPSLFVPTDAGIVRVEAAAGALAVTRAFPDTAELVSAGDRLHLGPAGLDVRTRDGARRLTLT